MRDGSAIAEATNAAATPFHDGDLAAARAMPRGVLGEAPPMPVTAGQRLEMDVAEAASLYAGVLAASGRALDGLGYSTFAYETACQDAQPGSNQRLRAAATHAYLLRATGDPAAAVPVARDLALQLVARFGATDRRTLAAHGDLAVTLHTAGACLTGRQILHRTGELVRDTYGSGDPLGVRMRDRLADLTRQCRATGIDGAESADGVADHICGQPATTVSISIADLFGDLFAMDFVIDVAIDDHEVPDPPPSAAIGPTETHSAVIGRPSVAGTGALAALGMAIPAAGPPAPSADPLAPADVRSDVGVTDVADAADTAHIEANVVSLDAGGEVEAAPNVDVDGTGASVPDVPPWADRPTAGFPTVPVAVGLHPTCVAASPAPVAATRRIDETSTVDAIGSAFADRPVTHSRATFGRMRRRVTHVAAAADADERLQRTATAGSTKTAESE